jgi:tetratricopeptide (TPR) repeat protein
MTDILEEMQHAIALHLRGRSDDALEISSQLLPLARGTKHGAMVYRRIAEFLHAVGNYDRARQMAEEAGSLARASRNSSEIMAAALVRSSCDMYEGKIAATHKQLNDLINLAGNHPMPKVCMAQLMLLVGNFDDAIKELEKTRELLTPRKMEIQLAYVLLAIGKTHYLAKEFKDAQAILERVIEFEVPTLVPGTLAQALLGLVLTHTGQEQDGCELVSRAIDLGRKISNDVYGHTMALGGLAQRHLGDLEIATEQLRSAAGLLTHSLERQETYYSLGRIAEDLGQPSEAEEAFKRATEPTIDSYFGRRSIKAIRDLVGLRVV